MRRGRRQAASFYTYVVNAKRVSDTYSGARKLVVGVYSSLESIHAASVAVFDRVKIFNERKPRFVPRLHTGRCADRLTWLSFKMT
jgi:hypothetical protein